MPIVMVSHNMSYVADTIDKVICIDNRQVAIHETEIITKEFIEQLNNGHYKMIKHYCYDHAGKI